MATEYRIIRNERDGRWYPQHNAQNNHIGGWQSFHRGTPGPAKNYCESFTTEAKAQAFLEKRTESN